VNNNLRTDPAVWGDKLVAVKEVKEGRLQQGGGDSHQSDFFLRHAFLFFKKFF
jgi:hypothetical protein